MKNWKIFITFASLLTLILGNFHSVDAQQNLGQQAYAIFEQSCLNCHGEHGAFTEEIIIEHTALIETGAVVPGKPAIESELYRRLLENDPAKRMPLGQPQLPPAAILTIGRWIQAGAPNWEDTSEADGAFTTSMKMLDTIEKHVNSLSPFDRTFARYFTLTHLYNAGESAGALHAYQRALSKLVNSLSWGREVTIPQAIDPEETIFYIDLRDYEWEIGTNRWTLMEAEYPYEIEFNAPTQTSLREKLTNLREEIDCEVPFIHVDWFLATASLPPLYHDILDLPETDRELEARLEVNVAENIRNAAGKRVWRAGFSDSGVSNNNRVVERHLSRYGAYWKSYDFAGSVGTQNIFTHPLSFTHDGGEIIFNLPNGLQAYYLADASGRRLNKAPINIVSNPAVSDPTVRNGLSCIGCHTEGMKKFEDQVRTVVEKNPNPPFSKARALNLYVDKATMDAVVDEDTDRYRQILEATGDVFGGIEPVQRFHEAFQGPVDAAHAAAAVGLETEIFLGRIRQNTSLQNLGLLVLETGTMKRDTWTSKFGEVVFALDFPAKSVSTPIDQQPERIPGESVRIPDPNLRAAIAGALGKAANATITVAEMATLKHLKAVDKGIRDLTGLEYATNLETLELRKNQMSDLSALSGLKSLKEAWIEGKMIADLSPFVGLANLEGLRVWELSLSDLSPLKGLTKLRWLSLGHNSKSVSDLSPLVGLISLKKLQLYGMGISDISPLANLTGLKDLSLPSNNISDVSPLTALSELELLGLQGNNVSDFSPLKELFGKVPIWSSGNPAFPIKGPKIEGPWLWMVVPIEKMSSIDAATSGIDFLEQMSDGVVTELEIATNGAKAGEPVGDNVWTISEISPVSDNIHNLVKATNLRTNNAYHYVAYGSIILVSPKNQVVNMLVGSSDSVKIWLNGELVHYHAIHRGTKDYHEFVPVTLKKGANRLLVAVYGKRDRWTGFFGFEKGTEYVIENPSVGYTFSKNTIHLGDTFTVQLDVENIVDLAGWQFDIAFDPAMLEVLEVKEGDFLKQEGATTFFQKGVINNRSGRITELRSARLSEGGVSGMGNMLLVSFKAKAEGKTQLALRNFQLADVTGTPISAGPHEVEIVIAEHLITGDVNRDGQVSILDLVLVAQHFGKTVPVNSEVDINGDGVINVLDLILVSQNMGESNGLAAPLMLSVDSIEGLDPAIIQAWIERAQVEDDGSIAFQEGIANLQRLLASLIPEETGLLPNYPNPFNPETWIPYQLSKPADVTLRIYSVGGSLIRTLALGHMPTGIYQSCSRAAYWDGRNDVGESVASGVYFYTLTAGDFTATRKMLTRK